MFQTTNQKLIVYYWWHLRCMGSLYIETCVPSSIPLWSTKVTPILCSPHSVLKGIICLVGMDEALNIGQCLKNKLTDYTRADHGNFTGSQELNWSYFNSNKYKRTVKTQKMNQDEQVASHGCPWCRKVPTWFPHLAFDDFPIEIPNGAIPSAVLVWDKHSRAKYLSIAPFGCPRVGLESDNFGAEKKASCKKNG